MSEQIPDSAILHPCIFDDVLEYAKPTIKNPNIEVGEFTFITDGNFENHVKHMYDTYNDKLIIGKYCSIGAGCQFIMNGANHRMNSVSTFPFHVMKGWNVENPAIEEMPNKGDTIIGNDVWFGENVTVLPGVHIGDGAIVGINSVVASNVDPYTIVAGNPAKEIGKRLDNELIELLLELKWWNFPPEKVVELMPILSSSDKDFLKTEIKKLIAEGK